MKPLTAKQSEIAMRFFTPDLYLRFNSNNDEIADQANDEWEKAIDSYQTYLKKLNLPESVKKLTEINLHDAELSDFQEVDLHQTVMSLKNNQYVYCLIYQTTNLVRKENFPQKWLFSDQRKHFLYDELDLQDSAFLHRILWSDGEILEIPFTSIIISPTKKELSMKQLHEEKIIELCEKYQGEGYSVSRDPDRLPFPLRGYVPDLIVSKNGGGFIIEVKNKSSGISIETVKRLAEEVATHESWRFLLVTLDDIGDTSPKNSEYVNVCWEEIGSRLKKVQQILDLEIFDAAILYLWTVFEIMMRKRTFDLKLPFDKFSNHQLINYLYTEGEISIDELDIIKGFLVIRNKLAHGDLLNIDTSVCNTYFSVINSLYNEWNN